MRNARSDNAHFAIKVVIDLYALHSTVVLWQRLTYGDMTSHIGSIKAWYNLHLRWEQLPWWGAKQAKVVKR